MSPMMGEGAGQSVSRHVVHVGPLCLRENPKKEVEPTGSSMLQLKVKEERCHQGLYLVSNREPLRDF